MNRDDEPVRFADHQKRPVDPDPLKRLMEFACERLGIGKAVSLALVDDGAIRDLNLRFKGEDDATDVLAFPLDDPAAPDPEPELGEIVVSADTAFLQAAEAGIPFEREVALLALHGLLHLAGMDDATPETRAAMQARAGEIFDAFEGR
jgi:probable rRNA maturation factor